MKNKINKFNKNNPIQKNLNNSKNKKIRLMINK